MLGRLPLPLPLLRLYHLHSLRRLKTTNNISPCVLVALRKLYIPVANFVFVVGDVKPKVRLSDDSTNFNGGEYATHLDIYATRTNLSIDE